ncbi:pyridoxal phosphate-dependent decarboxylase family protein [Cytobacillus sp. BC1816]|uniref:pyridoxal phosphate-dependent decarboxylase family protein n=1 Tax=Cytobacillus sp. BC1816 TaxID=3440154 RepID=UPI003F5102EF
MNQFKDYFLSQHAESQNSFQRILSETQNLLSEFYRQQPKVFNGKKAEEIEKEIALLTNSSINGESPSLVLKEIMEKVVSNSIHVTHPGSMAHLHCPTLIPAIAAELIIAVLNQSMDSWDQSTAATYLEEKLVKWLAEKLLLADSADGTFTSGGTQSNYMGLLLARDHFCQSQWNWDVKKLGLPAEAHKLRILCSEKAHFTVSKSASQLGLGEQAVVKIKTDAHMRMCDSTLKKEIQRLKSSGYYPMCIAATCGTTDFGSIDALGELTEAASENGMWLHVDAAYGGALVLSKKHCGKLAGINLADSVTIDFHKMFYQPISCGAFFVKNKSSFQYLSYHADYLNPEEEDLDHLVNKSVQTTRRFDALKLYMSLRIVGERDFSCMIDHTIELAKQTALWLKETSGIEVINTEPELNAIVFRFTDETDADGLNLHIYKKLLHSGEGLIAKTKINGSQYLKFTLLNPQTTMTEVKLAVESLSQSAKEYKQKEEAL